MKLLPALMIGLLLTLGTSWSVGAQPTLPQGPTERPCDQPADAAESGKPDGHSTLATVKGVDHQQGILELVTKDGQVSMTTPPAEIHDVREGDQLLICLEGDAIEDEERLADTAL